MSTFFDLHLHVWCIHRNSSRSLAWTEWRSLASHVSFLSGIDTLVKLPWNPENYQAPEIFMESSSAARGKPWEKRNHKQQQSNLICGFEVFLGLCPELNCDWSVYNRPVRIKSECSRFFDWCTVFVLVDTCIY